MKLSRDNRRDLIARAKWHTTHVFIPQQEPAGWKHDLEAMKRDASERGERYYTVSRKIRAGGYYISAIVLLIGAARAMKPVWIGSLESAWSYEILTTGADNTAEKRELLAQRPVAATVEGRRTWPAWLLSVSVSD